MLRTITLCLVAACGATTLQEKPGPRGLRADQHLAIASREDARADELAHWPAQRVGGLEPASGAVWVGTWDTAAEHRRNARAHRTDAAALEAEYEQACGDSPGELVSVSPLVRYGVGNRDIPNGTAVLLAPEAGPPDKLLSAMRCHRAWMMLGRTDMDDCPLDLPGLRVDARGDRSVIELELTVDAPQLVTELRRRAAHELEAHVVH